MDSRSVNLGGPAGGTVGGVMSGHRDLVLRRSRRRAHHFFTMTTMVGRCLTASAAVRVLAVRCGRRVELLMRRRDLRLFDGSAICSRQRVHQFW